MGIDARLTASPSAIETFEMECGTLMMGAVVLRLRRRSPVESPRRVELSTTEDTEDTEEYFVS